MGQQTFTLQNSGFSSGQLTPSQLKRMQGLFAATIPPEMKNDPTPLQLKVMYFAGGV